MTNNIKFASDMESLAEASYAKFDNFPHSESGVVSGLIANGFSNSQAVDFIQDWTIITGSHQPDMTSGFSATLFKGIGDNNDLAGEYVLAIRGTAGSVDLLADGGDIILDGLAVVQIIDLYNYMQKFTRTGNYQAAKLKRVEVISSSRGVCLLDTLRKQRKLAA